MRKHTMALKVISIAGIAVLLAGFAGAGPGQSAIAAVPLTGNTITYNLWATDGFISLADGTIIYNYGFVGGRVGQPLTYQNSMVAPPAAPKTFVPGAAVTVPMPAMTGGPTAAVELPLAGNAQFPAPLIYAAVGDVVQINFKNLGVTNRGSPNDPHSIHLHGLDVDAANDGVPETSVGAVPANLAIPGAGNVIVYMFVPQNPGTYMYHCHQEADIHVQMGMYGALVVYNPADLAYSGGGPGKGLGGTLWGWKYDKDVIMLLSEIDVRQHTSEQAGRVGGGAVFNPVNYQPQYWLINGLSFPNTVHASAGPKTPFNWTAWNLAHPGYDPLIMGSVSAASSAGGTGQKVLIRVINLGFETQPMHMHGYHGKILGSDQRAWFWANKADDPAYATGLGLEKNTLTVGSGETYEWLVDFGAQPVNAKYPAGTQSRYGPAPAILPQVNTNAAAPPIPVPAPVVGQTYIGGPTVGGTIDPAINAANGLTAAGPQIFPFHNHDDYKATNNGVYPGGQFTVLVPLP
jgi:manganese oxidase